MKHFVCSECNGTILELKKVYGAKVLIPYVEDDKCKETLVSETIFDSKKTPKKFFCSECGKVFVGCTSVEQLREVKSEDENAVAYYDEPESVTAENEFAGYADEDLTEVL